MSETNTKRYAHEIAPWPGEDAPFVEHVRYAVARAQGFWLRFMEHPPSVSHRDYVIEAIYTGQNALLLTALYDGLVGEDAYRWMWERSQDGDIGEWLWEIGGRLGIDMSSIKGYATEPATAGNAGYGEVQP